MIRAEAFNAAGGYEPNYSHGEDYRLFARILSKHKGAKLDQVLVTKRETSNGLTFKISSIAHMRIGLHNRLYAARMLSPKMTGYIQAILSGLSIPLIRHFGINREKLRSLFPVRNKGRVHDHH